MLIGCKTLFFHEFDHNLSYYEYFEHSSQYVGEVLITNN